MTRKLLLVFAMLGLVGCTDYSTKEPPATVKVTGKVVLPGGQPLSLGIIRFEPAVLGEGTEGFASIKQDGTFTVKSFGDREGLKPGKYVAYLDPAPFVTTDIRMKKAVKSGVGTSIPDAYLAAGTSKWKFEITEAKDLGTLAMN
jgi:hypothetical protein